MQNIDSATVQIRGIKREDINAMRIAVGISFAVPGPEQHWIKLGSALKRSGINTSLVAEARTTMLQAECER